MRPAVREATLGTGIALVLILLATGTRAVAAEKAPPSIHGETEYSILLDRLAQTRREEGSLRFAGEEARLAQLKMKKMEIHQRLALLQEGAGRSTRLIRGSTYDDAGRGFPSYSGAPLLSFHDATQFAPGALPYTSFGIIFNRLFFTLFLILAFVFSVMAIEKRTVHLRRKGRTWMITQYTKLMKGLRGKPPGEIVRRAMRKGRIDGATPQAA